MPEVKCVPAYSTTPTTKEACTKYYEAQDALRAAQMMIADARHDLIRNLLKDQRWDCLKIDEGGLRRANQRNDL